MSYAQQRRVVDVDSHLMEWPTFLTDHAPKGLADRLPTLAMGSVGIEAETGRRSEAGRAELVALGDDLVRRGPKWWAALGAVDRSERVDALDLLGFERQVVYSSFCAQLFSLDEPDLRYGAYRAHNQAMAAFCDADPRLSGVAICDLDDPGRALSELDAALELGLGQVWLPARAPGGRSPGHPAHDGFWATLAERAVPFVLHVGSAPLNIAPEWNNDGRQPDGVEQVRKPQAEIISANDLMVIYQPIERFISILVLDGVLERFAGLRGGAIELGAGWVPDMLRRLDNGASIWSKSEPRLAAFERRPSEQIVAQLRFTPYPFEDVGLLSRVSPPELYMFSSDYPHAEGGRDPIRNFEKSLEGHDPDLIERFFSGNAAAWLSLDRAG